MSTLFLIAAQIPLAYLLAQIPEPLWGSVAQGGVLSAVIGFLFWERSRADAAARAREAKRDERDERRDAELSRLTGSVDRISRSVCLLIVTHSGAPDAVKDQARDIHAEMTSGNGSR